MPIDRSCPRCGTHDAELDGHGVYDRVSTGWGRTNEEWTWYCSVWCREAANGVPPMFRCLTQTRLDDYGSEQERPAASIVASALPTSGGLAEAVEARR